MEIQVSVDEEKYYGRFLNLWMKCLDQWYVLSKIKG